jgi:cytidylate kinase
MLIVITGADGAGGGVILPAVAERLGLPVQSRSAPETVPNSGPNALSELAFREKSEAQVRSIASTTGGVIRDGAAIVILPEESVALRVRLDGPIERRVRQSLAHIGDADEAAVRAQLEASDAAWERYYRRAYGIDIADPQRYHMVLDSTALDWTLCVDMIERAARSRTQQEAHNVR